jgi:hypothetical protein
VYFITNGKVCWHIENQIGEWFENGAFKFTYDGWSMLQTGNLMITQGWIVGVCGEIIPKTKKAKRELEDYIRRATNGKTNRNTKT